jgi:pyruvate/2-oxoglutarate/acetoin dehydrogenase E1 component/TPP-dependent pyruvate/acetoin dehydrogenase alpha subunit
LSSTKAAIEKSKTKRTLPGKAEVLADYRLAVASREASLIGRKEVFMGKAKFGIFGDGKEVAQLAMAKVFQNGDIRSGYYRDQTFMFAIGELTIKQYFAQLYADPSVVADPSSAGRSMNGHFATRMLDENGKWKNQTNYKNSSADVSPTASQMPRLLGLAYASKLYRNNKELGRLKDFSKSGNEVAFGTIGNASTSEGMFFETMNAAGVLQVPMLISIWDDDYGISVPKEFHTIRGSISAALEGFGRTDNMPGFEILKVKGWDYEGLIETYQTAEKVCREEHIPVMIHVTEMTQPQGHSTSGSHERYKSKERLKWEKDFDCISKLKEFILENKIESPEQLNEIEKEAKNEAKVARNEAWTDFMTGINAEQKEAVSLLKKSATQNQEINSLIDELEKTINPIRADAIRVVKKAIRILRTEHTDERNNLVKWILKQEKKNYERFSSHLYSESAESALTIVKVDPVYDSEPVLVDGREILQANFDKIFEMDPRVLAIGEDVGKIGDVNQGMAGLQEKYGELRLTDTSIRECTIIGQGIGCALRGLKPIAEIQYLDYLLYAIQILSDDLATLQYRTKGGQKAPMIIRTRGHRLEGVWHSGSPMGMIINSLRGIYVLVPRNMTQAAGFYNTILASDDPALIVEPLNGYRLKEKLPVNPGEFKTPLGIPEILREGSDVTVVTYGSMCRIVMDAASQLSDTGIECEVIDVQSLLPFDINHSIVESLKKTNRIIFMDEDVEGGTTAYMMQQVLEVQGGYQFLDSLPATLTSRPHRPAYASDGDYFSKPNSEDVFDKVYSMIAEANPSKFPDLYN